MNIIFQLKSDFWKILLIFENSKTVNFVNVQYPTLIFKQQRDQIISYLKELFF